MQRKADIVSCQFILDKYKDNPNDDAVIESKQHAYFNIIADSTLIKHSNHATKDLITGINTSFGVVRMANISPCITLTKYLLNHQWPVNTQVRVMAYHSQQILLMRHEQERHLDQILKRKEKDNEQPLAFSHPVIRHHLDNIHKNETQVRNLLFILVATPVEEVGRDHDFDWAVVEPSSYRSIVQLAGRVRRHRKGEITEPNVSLMQYNWKGIRDYHKSNAKVFNRPGFENMYSLNTHDLSELIDEAAVLNRLDSIPRIQKPLYLNAAYNREFKYASSLSELEHVDTWRLLANYGSKYKGPNSLQGYLEENWFLTALSQKLIPFRKSEPSLKIFLVYDEHTECFQFCEKNEQGYAINRELILGIRQSQLTVKEMSRLWLERDFEKSVHTLAQKQEVSSRKISLRYGELSFGYKENSGYEYNDQLGLVKT